MPAQKSHFEGGEEDVEGFGGEAGGRDRDAVLAARQEYLSAVVQGDYETACARLSKGVTQSLQAMVKPGRAVPCREILPSLLSPGAARVSASEARGEVVKVRLKGEGAIVVFHAPGARLWAQPLSRERGDWRVTSLSAAILAPSAATLGE